MSAKLQVIAVSKRPVLEQGVRLTAENYHDVLEWATAVVPIWAEDFTAMDITLADGSLATVRIGEWIIRDKQGFLTTLNNDDLHSQYQFTSRGTAEHASRHE